MAAPLAKMRQYRGCRLFDRAAGYVDQRPIVSGAEPARCGDFLGDRLPIDILVIVAMGFEPEKPVLADLHDPFRSGVKPYYQRTLERLETRRQWHAGHQRYIRGFHAAIGEVNRGRRLRSA